MIRYSKIKCIVFFTIVIATCLFLRIRSRRHYYNDELSSVENEYEYGTLEYFVPKNLKKQDWHNYTQIEFDEKRVGIGEQGRPGVDETKNDNEKYKTGFNEALSNQISLDRSLPDTRHPGCSSRLYLESLPTVSVVIPFYEELLSTLLRTVHSVLNRSPSHLIKEVILVNDGGMGKYDNDSMSKQLVRYVNRHLSKVKVLRMLTRSGLMAARNAGARHATGQVLVAIDSHTEVNVNWLPPLLEPIALDFRTVVLPSIDHIAPSTLAYQRQGSGRGIMDWELDYKRVPLPPEDVEKLPEPYETPIMRGGLFAISRAFFWELGGYDPGLREWAGEQYELSFKIWQCGGRMLEAPCSRIGHLYRARSYSTANAARNIRRVVEVWMDEYAKFVYMRRPDYLTVDPGDLMGQKELRHWLKCKPFRWFLKEVAFEITARYPLIEPDPFARGQIRPLANTELCVDAYSVRETDALGLEECIRDNVKQTFTFTRYRDIRFLPLKMCWTMKNAKKASSVHLEQCLEDDEHQIWRYHPDTKKITYQTSDTSCVDWSTTTRTIFVAPCSERATQEWLVDGVNLERIGEWGKPSVTNAPALGRSYKVDAAPSTKALRREASDFK